MLLEYEFMFSVEYSYSVRQVATLVYVCVGEWSGHQWSSVAYIHWRLMASSPVAGQRRSCVSSWLRSWHSAARQRATTTTRPHWQKLSSQAVAARTITLRRTHIATLRCTQQQWWVASAWRRISIQSTLSDRVSTLQSAAQLKLLATSGLLSVASLWNHAGITQVVGDSCGVLFVFVFCWSTMDSGEQFVSEMSWVMN